MDIEVVVCSASGKPIFHFHRPSGAATTIDYQAPTTAEGEESDDGGSGVAHSFVSSLQGLLSFVSCVQHEELQELDAPGCRCIFRAEADTLTYATISRAGVGDGGTTSDDNGAGAVVCELPPRRCLRRLLRLLHGQILQVLSARGLDVLRRQPGYDLRELLIGTDRTMIGLTGRWARKPEYRLPHCGVSFLRLDPDDRLDITQTLEYEPPSTTTAVTTVSSDAGMVCGLLLAAGQVVAVAQPLKKQFRVLVDDLLLLINFIYETPSFTKAETWTPVCLPSFNDSGFLQAYVVFLTPEIALVLLSTQQSPERFHQFQIKRAFVQQRLTEGEALDRIQRSIDESSTWRPHRDLPMLHHFVYKNELTGECACPTPEFPFDDEEVQIELLNHFAQLQHRMLLKAADESESQILGKRRRGHQESITARLVVERTTSALYMGLCHEDYRLFASFDSLTTASDAQDQCQLLLERLKRDEELMSIPLFASNLWP